jgi:hypothetical protein
VASRWRVEFCSGELSVIGWHEVLPVFVEVLIGDEESRLGLLRSTTITPSSLLVLVSLEIDELARCSHRGGESSEGGSLIPAPDTEVQDNVDASAQSTKRQPDEATFEHASLPVGVVVLEQGNHPLVGSKPQCPTFFLNQPGPSALPGCWQTDHDEQRRCCATHTSIVSQVSLMSRSKRLPGSRAELQSSDGRTMGDARRDSWCGEYSRRFRIGDMPTPRGRDHE